MSEGQLWLPLGAASAAAAQKEALQGRSADVGAQPAPPSPSPLSASSPDDDDATRDDWLSEDEDLYADCGRWSNGRLGSSCSMAGTEFCDWECPYR